MFKFPPHRGIGNWQLVYSVAVLLTLLTATIVGLLVFNFAFNEAAVALALVVAPLALLTRLAYQRIRHHERLHVAMNTDAAYKPISILRLNLNVLLFAGLFLALVILVNTGQSR